MSFYTTIKTELASRATVILALKELKSRGEIRRFEEIKKSGKIEIDRSGDIISIATNKAGELQLEGDARIVETFLRRLKQMYAYESIKENLPLDFEISEESEIGGEISITLKG
ncbi:MAG: hypothetical protein KAS88_01035 [Deltaproteobacteria bacterium]|nr:hypothetical protein [Deltaproteobacteria bacterium]